MKKKWVNKINKLELKHELYTKNNKKYKIKVICNNKVYIKKIVN